MNIQTGGKVSGVYGIKVLRNAGTDKEHLEDFGESPNMLLDGFFERFASGELGTNWYCFVGTGTGIVESQQSSLESAIGQADNMILGAHVCSKELDDYVLTQSATGEWGIGAIVGNISEVGIEFGGNNPSTLDSRALITDAQGSPTTITVTSEDKLIVKYTLRYIIPTQQHVSTVDFSGVSTTCTLEALNTLNNYWNIRAAFADFKGECRYSSNQQIVNNPESSIGSASSSSVSVTYSRQQSGVRRASFFADTNALNAEGGLEYVAFCNPNANFYIVLGLHFSPKIPKDNTKTLTLNLDFTLTRA